MPLYEYECTACHKRTEKIQKFSDPEITTCPKCGGVLERVLSAPAISFKGGGWFADGYGNANPKSEGTTEGSSDSTTPDKSAPASGSSESKSSPDTSAGTAAPASAPAAAPAAAASSSPAPAKN